MGLENLINTVIDYAEKGYEWRIVESYYPYQIHNYIFNPKEKIYLDTKIFQERFKIIDTFIYGTFHPLKTIKFAQAIYKLRLPELKRKSQ
jgi:hypothetical protein